MNRKLIGAGLAVLLIWTATIATAEEDTQANPPEILTSDLTLKTLLDSNRIEANFVIVDDDEVVEVTINGEIQSFEPGDTVLIVKELVFSEEVSEVVVTAKDAAGHSKTVTYTVYLAGVSPERVVKKEEAGWFVNYDAKLEYDSNPTQDLSTPFAIEGVGDGVVDNDEQADSRLNIKAYAGMVKGPWRLFGGISRIEYSKSTSSLDVALFMLGATYRRQQGGFEMGYLFTYIKLNTFDYALTHWFSPGLRSHSTDEDGTTETLWGLDLVAKQFLTDIDQANVVDFHLKWDYSTLDLAKQDSYHRLFLLGKSSEGLDATKYYYFSMDFDWENQWDSGLLWDIGFGWQARKYPDVLPSTTELFGKTRVDNPLRFSTAVGYQLLKNLKLMSGYRYVFDFSNSVPYVRHILSAGVEGTF